MKNLDKSDEFARMGIECINNGDFYSAISAFENSIKINPQHVTSLLFLAICKFTVIDELRDPQSINDNIKDAILKVKEALTSLEDLEKSFFNR